MFFWHVCHEVWRGGCWLYSSHHFICHFHFETRTFETKPVSAPRLKPAVKRSLQHRPSMDAPQPPTPPPPNGLQAVKSSCFLFQPWLQMFSHTWQLFPPLFLLLVWCFPLIWRATLLALTRHPYGYMQDVGNPEARR